MKKTKKIALARETVRSMQNLDAAIGGGAFLSAAPGKHCYSDESSPNGGSCP